MNSFDETGRLKKDIRKSKLAQRRKLTETQVLEMSKHILTSVVSTDIYKASGKLCLYMPIHNEVDVSLLIDRAISDKKEIFLPKVNGDSMDFYYYDRSVSLLRGAYDILEPESEIILSPDEATLIIMPGAAFSKNCDRIGYGGGYYDRYLERYPYVNTIAVAYDFQIDETLPSEHTDYRPDYIIGEDKIYVNSYRIRN